MKKLALLAAIVAFSASAAQADLLITEVVDGNRIASDGSAGANPDPFLVFMELTNTGGTDIDLSNFHYINMNNGGNSAGFSSTQLSGILAAGDCYYIAYESSGANNAFNVTYGYDANEYTGGKFINGDDVMLLLDTEYVGGSGALDTNTIVDVFGVLGVDGSGEAWEYTDGGAKRNVGVTAANSTFDIGEWNFTGVDIFDNQGAAFHVANTTVKAAIPEPTTAAIAGLALVGFGLIRRRK